MQNCKIDTRVEFEFVGFRLVSFADTTVSCACGDTNANMNVCLLFVVGNFCMQEEHFQGDLPSVEERACCWPEVNCVVDEWALNQLFECTPVGTTRRTHSPALTHTTLLG